METIIIVTLVASFGAIVLSWVVLGTLRLLRLLTVRSKWWRKRGVAQEFKKPVRQLWMSERFEGMWSNPEHEDRVLLLEVIAESVRAILSPPGWQMGPVVVESLVLAKVPILTGSALAESARRSVQPSRAGAPRTADSRRPNTPSPARCPDPDRAHTSADTRGKQEQGRARAGPVPTATPE